ncbi:MAG TPA: hypothetical protein VIC62_02450, partial [Nakamurella sp.]
MPDGNLVGGLIAQDRVVAAGVRVHPVGEQDADPLVESVLRRGAQVLAEHLRRGWVGGAESIPPRRGVVAPGAVPQERAEMAVVRPELPIVKGLVVVGVGAG